MFCRYQPRIYSIAPSYLLGDSSYLTQEVRYVLGVANSHLRSPKEGAVFYLGEAIDLLWVSPAVIDMVVIDLYKGEQVARLLANPAENDCEHWWKIHDNLIPEQITG